MNEFEKKISALRSQFKAEQRQITKDAYLKVGHINTAIGKVDLLEAREALRAERERIFERMRQSHEVNRNCYLQLLEMINEQQLGHYNVNPSGRQLRRMMAQLCTFAESKGMKSISLSFGNKRSGIVTFD